MSQAIQECRAVEIDLNCGTAGNVTIGNGNVAIEVDRLNASQGTIAKAIAAFANMVVDSESDNHLR